MPSSPDGLVDNPGFLETDTAVRTGHVVKMSVATAEGTAKESYVGCAQIAVRWDTAERKNWLLHYQGRISWPHDW